MEMREHEKEQRKYGDNGNLELNYINKMDCIMYVYIRMSE